MKKNLNQINVSSYKGKIDLNDKRISPVIEDIKKEYGIIITHKNFPEKYQQKKFLINENDLFFSGGHIQHKLRKCDYFRQFSLQEKVISFGKLAMITYIIKEKNLKTQIEKLKMLGKLRIAFINFDLEVDHDNGNIWDNTKTNLILRSKKNHELKHKGLLKMLKEVN
jgi:hypothetical protein